MKRLQNCVHAISQCADPGAKVLQTDFSVSDKLGETTLKRWNLEKNEHVDIVI